MDEESYSLNWDPVRRLLKLRSSGFWTVETLARYEQQFDEILRKISAVKAPFDFVADLTEHPTQSSEVGERMTHYGIQMHAAGVRKVATIASGSALARMQTQRSAADLDNKSFSSEAEALAWLEE
jgi:hypothetical protein